jgi:hypothetical protein
MLRSDSADGRQEFYDMATGKARAKATEDLYRAVLDLVNARKSPSTSTERAKKTRFRKRQR